MEQSKRDSSSHNARKYMKIAPNDLLPLKSWRIYTELWGNLVAVGHDVSQIK